MRFDSLFLAAAAVAVLTLFAGNDVQAQFGQLQGGYSHVQAPTYYAPEYAPSPSSYHSQVATPTRGCAGCRGKGQVSTGQLNGGCRNCSQECPIRTQQDYSAVPSCCGTLGQLDIPALTTPPRLDRPPMGRSAGRPLFGQWQGF